MPKTSLAHPLDDSSHRAITCRLIEATHSLHRANRFFKSLKTQGVEQFDLASLSRLQRRVDGVVQLLSNATKDLKLIGIDKKVPLIEGDAQGISLQEASRRVRRIQTKLREKKVGDSVGDIVDAVTDPNEEDQPGNIHPTGFWGLLFVALAKLAGAAAAGAFNGTADDEARKKVQNWNPQDLVLQTDEYLIKLINDLLDGWTVDDDEAAILTILHAIERDCDRLRRIVSKVGLDRLLFSVDGEEWDQLIIIMVKCRIMSFDKMDDDASRRFIDDHTYYQLSRLHIEAVHQLVLNMFDDNCGDDDENAMLKLLGSQVAPKLQQLVTMPGTDVGAFDYNFDGEEWDRLELLFAANGITLDP